jgi:hypothetical protein
MNLLCTCGKGLYVDQYKRNQILSGYPEFCCSECFLQHVKQLPSVVGAPEYRRSTISQPHERWDSITKGFYRSWYEVFLARCFSEEGIRFEYEGYTIDLNGPTYTPDFYLLDKGVFVETKGMWLSASKKKLKMALSAGHRVLLLPAYLEKDFRRKYRISADNMAKASHL